MRRQTGADHRWLGDRTSATAEVTLSRRAHPETTHLQSSATCLLHSRKSTTRRSSPSSSVRESARKTTSNPLNKPQSLVCLAIAFCCAIRRTRRNVASSDIPLSHDKGIHESTACSQTFIRASWLGPASLFGIHAHKTRKRRGVS